MNPAVSNMVLMFGLMQLSKKIPFEDPMVVFYARCVYVASNIIIFAIYMFTRYKITQKNDLTTLKYVEPPSPMSGSSEKKLVTTTIKEYDLLQVTTALRSSLFGIAVLLFMHFKLGYTNPLVMQSILPLKSLFEQKIVQIHLLGKPAVGDLKRPFKAAGLFAGAGAGANVATDKKAIEEAEKSGLGGVKEE
ncbi:inorganic phosphate transport protein PHO88 [Myxozyma melibiosi]|uniref:Inorganic phosphate transport protein PHO88 n=1 Tax=Myxozyma melibiosi TaxID=54550 RepID=A0ABR1F2X2_9ASCO